jgi:hypothetical protein
VNGFSLPTLLGWLKKVKFSGFTGRTKLGIIANGLEGGTKKRIIMSKMAIINQKEDSRR